MKSSGTHGIKLWDIRICALLHAGDVILLRENENDPLHASNVSFREIYTDV